MLFDVDTIHGHVILQREDGTAVYEDDGSPVDNDRPRACRGCKLVVDGHDICIANLPHTKFACCGHGLARTPRSNQPSGYVALEDGRCFRFEGTVGGAAIRAVTDLALAGKELPEGFVYDEDMPWWTGLTAEQREYVEANTLRGLRELVVESGSTPSPEFDAGNAPWFEGLDRETKDWVWARIGGKLAQLVTEAKVAHPA